MGTGTSCLKSYPLAVKMGSSPVAQILRMPLVNDIEVTSRLTRAFENCDGLDCGLGIYRSVRTMQQRS